MSKEKSPAFQVYAAEYLSDINTQMMTIDEEGCYWRLMLFCWREKSLPIEIDMLKTLCKGTVPSGRVLSCFMQQGDRLIHNRLESERSKQAEWRAKCAKGGRNSAHKPKRPKRKLDKQSTSTTALRVVEVNEQGSRTLQSSIASSISSLNNKTPYPLTIGNGSSPLFEIYKEKNSKLPLCIKLTDDRKKKCIDRCKDPEFIEMFSRAVVKAQGIDFLTGSNDRGWKADFDWFIKNDKNVYKVLEGKYSGLFDEEQPNE
jgi:uncharacterized protein YdaU (DUF1376 family)